MLRVYSMTMSITSVFALFIGMFIIYNSFAIAVTQRRAEIGILRALGATRRQIRTLFLVESAVAGAGRVGRSASASGYLLARGDGRLRRRRCSRGSPGSRSASRRWPTDPWLMALALAMGVATSMVAAVIPARNAARVDPVQALQKGKYQVLSAGENRVRRVVAVGLCARSRRPAWSSRAAALAVLRRLPAGDGRRAAAHAGARAVADARAAAGARPAAAGEGRARGRQPDPGAAADVGHRLGADAVARADDRARRASSAASYESITDWMDTALNPDLFVTASPTLTSRSFLFPAVPRADAAARSTGVAEVQSVRTPRDRLPRARRCCWSPSRWRSGRRARGARPVEGLAATCTGRPPRGGR